MANSYFQFKQFTVHQDRCAMKVTTDGCLFGAWVAEQVALPQLQGDSREPEVGILESPFDKLRVTAKTILDIGTGTGLLSLMLAQKNPTAEIDAIEIDAEAAKQAQANADATPWKENIFVMPGDAKDMAFALGKEYDIIISNPPFYEKELTSPDLQKNIAHHGTALLLEDLLQIISGVLSPGGWFYILLPAKRMMEAGLLIKKYHFVVTKTILVRQSTQHAPFRIFIEGKRPGNDEEPYSKTEMAIKDEEGQYTESFVKLLKDYYLHL